MASDASKYKENQRRPKVSCKAPWKSAELFGFPASSKDFFEDLRGSPVSTKVPDGPLGVSKDLSGSPRTSFGSLRAPKELQGNLRLSQDLLRTSEQAKLDSICSGWK